MINKLESIFELSHSKHSTIRPMEGLRGFAVLLVFLVHYSSLCSPYIDKGSTTHVISNFFSNIGHAGVDLFFVLSGFLIYGMLLRKKQKFSLYLSRRVQRIYPVFIIVFLIYLALSFLLPSQSKIPLGFENALIYILQNFFLLPGIFDIEAMITVAWSLSYEFFFYLLTPIFLSAFGLRRWNYLYRIILLTFISVAGFIYTINYGGHIRMLMFLSGMILYEVVSHSSMTSPKNLGSASIFLAITIMALFPTLGINDKFKYIALFILMFILCWECFTTEGFIRNVFSWSLLRWYGNMSYSYYLIHGLALKGIFMVVGYLASGETSQLLYWILLIPSFFITLFASTILFIYVEKPYSLSVKITTNKK